MIYHIILSSLVLISSISLVSAAVDPFQSAIDDILRMPTVSKSTLPDGSVVTTVAIPGDYPTKAGTIVSPVGSVLQFTTQLGDPQSSTTTLPNYTTNPASSTPDFLSSPTRSLLQSTISNPVDILGSASTTSQSYQTVFTDASSQSVVISCSITRPCSSASVYSATNSIPFDLSSTTLAPAMTSVLTSGPASPLQSDSIREASIAPLPVDTTPAGFTRIFTSEKVPWASCICVRWTDATWKTEYDATGLACWWPVINRKYECTVPTGLAGFQSVFRDIVRVVINIVLLLSVLAVVGLGIAWSFAGGDDIKAKSILKTWAINIVIWLFILFMFGYILSFLAPWVYQ